jgi:soluble lytic murein transglycosylase-like protein
MVLVGAGALVAYQARRLQALRATAEELFYAARSVEVQNGRLEELVRERADPKQIEELNASRSRQSQLDKEYDAFVRQLGVYHKLSDQEAVIVRVARALGECDVNVPEEFVEEVRRFVERWRSTDRLEKTLARAKRKGYHADIPRAFARANLPPQYFFLALQESGFDERAVGPATRYGFAKGMWQFISVTAYRYGLRIGRFHDQAVYDAEDDRFDPVKATAAAVKYIKHLSANDAQGSGLLVMASYNWGEDNVRRTITSLPENPRDRNFWVLLRHEAVPRETYEYVLSIVSAAVICENPKLFGFALECP